MQDPALAGAFEPVRIGEARGIHLDVARVLLARAVRPLAIIGQEPEAAGLVSTRRAVEPAADWTRARPREALRALDRGAHGRTQGRASSRVEIDCLGNQCALHCIVVSI